MNLTFYITDESLTELRNTLRISRKDFERLMNCVQMQSGDYAHSILKARRLLDMSNSTNQCCFDWQEQTFQSLGDQLDQLRGTQEKP